MKTYRLYDIAAVLRSKNSGPFEITVDVIFDNPDYYYGIKDANIITKELVSKLYHIPEDYITNIVFFDPALGFKITFARKISSGTCFDTDVYGAQQHAPMMELQVTLSD